MHYIYLAWLCAAFGAWSSYRAWKARNNAYSETLNKFNGDMLMAQIERMDSFVSYYLDEDDKRDFITFKKSFVLPSKLVKQLEKAGYTNMGGGVWKSKLRTNIYVD